MTTLAPEKGEPELVEGRARRGSRVRAVRRGLRRQGRSRRGEPRGRAGQTWPSWSAEILMASLQRDLDIDGSKKFQCNRSGIVPVTERQSRRHYKGHGWSQKPVTRSCRRRGGLAQDWHNIAWHRNEPREFAFFLSFPIICHACPLAEQI